MSQHQINLQMEVMGRADPPSLNEDVATPHTMPKGFVSCLVACIVRLGIISLFAIRLFSFVTFIIFDFACFAYERRSVTNCSQKVILSNPLPIVHLWITTSNFTSIIVLICLYTKPQGITFCGFKSSYRKILKRGSFWSLNLIFFVIFIDYIVRFFHEGGWEKQAIPVTLAFMKLFHLLISHSVNFVHPLPLEREFICATYWLGIIFYCLEIFYLFISSSLDMGENIYPLGNSSADVKDRFFLVILSLFLGAKVIFHVRMLTFYWHKIFHGDKDYFSERHGAI